MIISTTTLSSIAVVLNEKGRERERVKDGNVLEKTLKKVFIAKREKVNAERLKDFLLTFSFI